MPTMDVRFRNPFYHNQFGLLGGADDYDTIYTLPDYTVLPQTAIIVEGVSLHRKENPPTNAEKMRVAMDDIDEKEREERKPKRAKPVEGKEKTPEPVVKKRKAKARK